MANASFPATTGEPRLISVLDIEVREDFNPRTQRDAGYTPAAGLGERAKACSSTCS